MKSSTNSAVSGLQTIDLKKEMIDLFEKKYTNSLNSIEEKKISDLEETSPELIDEYKLFSDFMIAIEGWGRECFRKELLDNILLPN